MQHVDPDTLPEIERRLLLVRTAVLPASNPADFTRLLAFTRTASTRCEIGVARLGLTTDLVLRQKLSVSLSWIYAGNERTLLQRLMLSIAEPEQKERVRSPDP